ncbi:MAG: DUF975 family protein [Clostridia bacterium]|nr:DUF975 family protein [Clostridia bacterium]
MNRAELKSKSKQQIKGKIGVIFCIYLVISFLSVVALFLLSLIPYGKIVFAIIVAPAFGLSLIRAYLNVSLNKKIDISDAICGFDDFWSAFKVQFFTSIFIYLWSLLFIIPGIVKSISYSMAMNILAENKGKPALECIKESKEMTKGHKAELFVLSLSFIGWILLGYVTFGIALIWVIPYMETTLINAYHSLKPVKAEFATEPEVIDV